MRTLGVDLGQRSYPIHIGSGLLDQAALVAPLAEQGRAVVVTNTTVGPLYLGRFRQTLSAAGIDAFAIELPDGEAYKTWETLNRVFDALLERRCERRTPMFALGGGVIGDIGGFAAACYQRGMPYVQVPTTLLSQVDSSVGGKTAINHPLGKNMIGAFYQPRAVIADMDTLATLPPRELAAGLAEVIKYGLIRDSAFFEWLETHIERLTAREPEALAHAVEQSCRNKSEVVSEDETETGVRAHLNLGHTFGHAIEAGLGFGVWLHGEAVAAGTMLAAELSCRMGLLDARSVVRARRLLERAGLPVVAPGLGSARYLELMGHDKKVQSGRIRFVLLRAIGDAFVSADVPGAALASLLDELPRA